MTEIIKLENYYIPYGVLHDQKLLNVAEEDNRLVFDFEIMLYENDYTEEIYLKYKDFTSCKMIVSLADEPFNYFDLTTSINRKGKFKGLSLNREELINCLNNSNATFVSCSTDGNYFNIEFSVSFYNYKNMKKYKKYDLCRLEIDCNDSVIWEWMI